MDTRIPQALIKELGTGILKGCTSKFNHVSCPAGVDTRMRLYITRTEKDVLLAYCHNCSGKGWVNEHTGPSNIHAIHYTPSTATRYPALDTVLSSYHYLDDSRGWSAAPMVARYMGMYNLDPVYTAKDHWSWGVERVAPEDSAIVWPFFDGHEQMTGFQVRYMTQVIRTPKVRTYGKMGLHIFNPHDSEILVIVEDRASGVRIGQAGFAACVIHGSRPLHTEEVHKLSMMFDQFVVWYDNDNMTVFDAAAETLRNLSLFTERRGMVCLSPASTRDNRVDPKCFSNDMIISMVTERLDARYSPA